MAENINKNNIDDIVSGVHETLKSGEFSGSGVRLEFVEEESESVALVFEEDEVEETLPDAKEAEKAPESEDSLVKAEEPASEKSEGSAPASIWTTYVPRFTEVSETYKMKNADSAAIQESSAPPLKRDREAPITLPEDDSAVSVDPTAENESELSGATLVTSGNSQSTDVDEVSTVFKFDGGEEPAEELRPVEENVADAPEEEPVSFEEEAPSEEEPLEHPSEDKPYVMPDPITEDSQVNLPQVKAPLAIETVDEAIKRKKRSEYTSFAEKDGFLDNFLDSIMSVRVRLIAAAVLALMLLFVENVSFLGLDLVEFLHFEGVGGALAIVSLPFLVGSFLLLLPEVIYSFTALARKKLVPEFFLTTAFGVLILYYTAVIIFAVSDDYSLYGFMFAVLAIFTLVSSYYKKKADFTAFKIASANGEKRVVDRKLTRNLPAEHRALDGKIEAYKSRTARVFRTSFVSDFSARSSLISENTAGNVIILSVSLGIALVSGVVAFFIQKNIVSAAMIFAGVYMLSLPAFVLITHKIPFYQAACEAKRESSAVIGEKSFYDYAGIDVITFDDTEIFGKEDVNLQRIMVYGRKENLPKALQQMSALFTVIGGPLAYIFANAVDRRVSPADNVAVDTDGVIGAIDGVEVMAGSAEFMERRGVEIPYDPTVDSAISQTTRIMYAAEGGEIYAKFYIRYMLSEEFTMILPILLDDGVNPLVYTRDPNINDGLFRSLTAGTDSIRVLKKQNLPESEVRLYRRISLGMVSVGDKTNIINTLLLSKKYAAFQAKISLAELPVMIGGAMLGLLLAICVPGPISSLLLSLWYVGWSAAVVLFGKKLFGVKKDRTKDKEEKETV